MVPIRRPRGNVWPPAVARLIHALVGLVEAPVDGIKKHQAGSVFGITAKIKVVWNNEEMKVYRQSLQAQVGTDVFAGSSATYQNRAL
ncbi:hypothetical protein MMYC01_203779 [Madurella mycetomatis]|uniref:Uncharacterized protein n=1 Tax=Madurella mycetomatis TaxID=100816 RepID=A0A175W7V6_9PEZI|nr:hypothetical protein MMYC01_203779 [Madurella mycetomatis]